jgi:hypothetical protein
MEKTMAEVPAISRQASEGMREVKQVLDSIKKNFLVRPYIPPDPSPQSHGVEERGE